MATSTDYFNQLQGMQMPPMQPIQSEDDMYRSLLGRAKNFNPLNTEIARAETQAYNSPTEAYENYNKLNPTSLSQYVMMPSRVGGVGGVGDYVTGDAIVNSMTDRYGRMLGLAGAARNALVSQRATLGDLARSMYQQQQAQREQQRQDYIDRYNQLKDMYSMQMQREAMAKIAQSSPSSSNFNRPTNNQTSVKSLESMGLPGYFMDEKGGVVDITGNPVTPERLAGAYRLVNAKPEYGSGYNDNTQNKGFNLTNTLSSGAKSFQDLGNSINPFFGLGKAIGNQFIQQPQPSSVQPRPTTGVGGNLISF